jgi:uncharacterized protein
MRRRSILARIGKRMKDEKAIIIMGPRQSGKTTMVKQLVSDTGKSYLWLNGDEADTRTLLERPTSRLMKNLVGKRKMLVIDEAQRIRNIGVCIKLVTDNLPGVKVIATGSSSFDLANKINEPLTGRKWEFLLLPFSMSEMAASEGVQEEKRLLGQRMVYGYYPEIVNNPGDEQERLNQLADSYLYKDLLTWENIQKPDKLERLVQALAYQVGSEVSYNELGQITGLDNETVEKYVALLEKAFIVFRLNSFSRNLRNELKKSRKIYFYDNGLRNAVIRQFNSLGLRNDTGVLWENLMVSERMKHLANSGRSVNRYFWRTHAQQEIDYIEDYDGKLHAYEFKWNPKKKAAFPAAFLKAYRGASTEVVDNAHFSEFVGLPGDR